MGESIEINIYVKSVLISDLHNTITSILEQNNLDVMNIYIRFINLSHIDLHEEQKRITNHNIQIIDKMSDSRFLFVLESGDVISRSFLYKGYHFLLNNTASFVCPEYTFRRIDNTLVISTIKNDQILLNCAKSFLMDRKKTLPSQKPAQRASIIKDSCSSRRTIDIDYNKYIQQTKKKTASFDSPLFLPQNISELATPDLFKKSIKNKSIKQKVFSLVKASTGRSKILKKLYESDDSIVTTIHANQPPYISQQMKSELEQISNINLGLKGYLSMNFIDLTYEYSLKSERLFSAYFSIKNEFEYDNYSYIMILPWLISGGIDLFAVNYLNTIAELHPKQNILVILTNDAHRSFSKEKLGLAKNITLLDLPLLFNSNQTYFKQLPELVYSIINIFRPKRLHVIASKVGYDCVINHGDYIRANNTKILFSSYNYLTGQHGEYMGYSVQELPLAYRPGDIITTDNSVSKEFWVNHFGFLADDILVHHQLFDRPKITMSPPTTKDGLHILWAAHIRPEKNPEILPDIAEKLQSDKIDIDCYGLFSPINWENGENPLDVNNANLHYRGPYNDFFKDIDLKKYDLFLYTSHADGTPNVIIEAALAGLPIVASEIGGIPETLCNKAILVKNTYSSSDFVQAIRSALSNPDDARRKAKNLQKTLYAIHNKENFVTQVKEMLKRSRS